MLSFKKFLENEPHPLEKDPEEIHPLEKSNKYLHDFIHHLTSFDIPHTYEEEDDDDIDDDDYDDIYEEKKPTKGELKLRKSDIKLQGKLLKRQKWAFTGGTKPLEKTAYPIDQILQQGMSNRPSTNLYQNLKTGFHAAFPENEDPKETKQKARLARKHFRQFMSERGGHERRNNLNLTNENGKTKLSSGEGVQTTGLSLAPHHSSGYEEDLCPNASSECRTNCLGFTAGGNKQYPEVSFRAKLLRTQYLAEHPENAARLISHEISENEKWSERNGYKPGFRANITSDLPWHKLMPRAFFDRHNKTQFYDYTKNPKRLDSELPPNYSLALSHTGTGHEESNDADVINALNKGHVVAMVHQPGNISPTHVEDTSTGKRYPIVNGDKDDNVYDRHKSAGIPKTQGVVSGLKLKGVKKEAAGNFANKVDDDGIIRLYPTKTQEAKKAKADRLKREYEIRRSQFISNK